MKTSYPIARLRNLGCKVATVIGHDAPAGEFRYSVRVPNSLGDLREGFTSVVRLGNAVAMVPAYSDGHHILVKTLRVSFNLEKSARKARILSNETDVADLLTAIAETIEED